MPGTARSELYLLPSAQPLQPTQQQACGFRARPHCQRSRVCPITASQRASPEYMGEPAAGRGQVKPHKNSTETPWKPSTLPSSPFPERQVNPLQDDIVDFAPLREGRLPEGLIERLWEIQTRMNDSGLGLSALGLCWCPGGSRRGSAALGDELLSYGASWGVLRPLGEGRDRHHTTTL